MDHRLFNRVRLSARCDLIHHDMTYRGRLENISLRGALLSGDECIMIPRGELGALSICLEGEETPLLLTVRVVHSFFSIAGVIFVQLSESTELRLYQLLKKMTSEPERLSREWEEIKLQRLLQKGAPSAPPLAAVSGFSPATPEDAEV